VIFYDHLSYLSYDTEMPSGFSSGLWSRVGRLDVCP